MTINNNLPAIVLEASGDIFISKNSKNFEGWVYSKDDFLKKLELSLNGGKSWRIVAPDDGAWDSRFEKFSLTLPALKGEAQTIILRGITQSGRSVTNAQQVRLFFDDVRPSLAINKFPKKTINDPALHLLGVATDDFSGIKAVEYSIDDSVFYEADILDGFATPRAEFEIIHKEKLADGDHVLAVRTVDRADNVSSVRKQSFSLDATPPRFGGFALTEDGQPVAPKNGDTFEVKPGSDLKLTAVVMGQPIGVSVFLDNAETALAFDATSSLWIGDFKSAAGGPFLLRLSAEDAAGNKNDKEIAQINGVVGNGEQPVPFFDRLLKIFGN